MKFSDVFQMKIPFRADLSEAWSSPDINERLGLGDRMYINIIHKIIGRRGYGRICKQMLWL